MSEKNDHYENSPLSNTAIVESLKPLLEAAIAIQKVTQAFAIKYAPIIEAVNKALPQLALKTAQAIEGMRIWSEKAHEFSERLEAEKTFLIPSFSSLGDIPNYLERMKNENISMMAIYDEYFSDYGNSKKILDHWARNPFFEERRIIFEDCLKAHAEKKYSLSIPVFYVHIEKYCKHLLGIDKRVNYEYWKNKLKETYKSNGEIEGIHKALAPDAAIDLILNHAFEFQNVYQNLSEPLCPNRHDILHGDDLDYFKRPYASLICILILDVLAQLEPKRELQ